ncbi:MAG: 6,7-dimethyl-8-ribityllumazine synthase [Candidatus Sumerlaeota bacterium]|nr:6,7-dimethyl-8-ribityllumazine synthase [Candidatus Sumerlaeota bacterium]
MARIIEGTLEAKGLKFALVVSRFNSLVTEELLNGALDCLKRHGAKPDDQTVVRVPGGWELPVAVKAVLDKGGFDGVIALGCVMKGQTTHNDYIVSEAAKNLGVLGLQSGIPVTFGVLTPNTLEQALERAGLKLGNKGAEAAEAAIEMANVMKQIKK